MDTTERLMVQDGPTPGSISLVGELDLSTIDQVHERFMAVPGSTELTVDMNGVTFIDSSALRVLIEHHQRFEDAGGKLKLANLSESTTRLLDISGLADHFHLT